MRCQRDMIAQLGANLFLQFMKLFFKEMFESEQKCTLIKIQIQSKSSSTS